MTVAYDPRAEWAREDYQRDAAVEMACRPGGPSAKTSHRAGGSPNHQNDSEEAPIVGRPGVLVTKVLHKPLGWITPGWLVLGHTGRWYRVESTARLTVGWLSLIARDVETGQRYEIRGEPGEYRSVTAVHQAGRDDSTGGGS